MGAEKLPLAQPAYVLRGHAASIHTMLFNRNNSGLLTGDAKGWVISWRLAHKRPAAVWQAHENAILGLANWGADRLITYGHHTNLSRDMRMLTFRGMDETES